VSDEASNFWGGHEFCWACRVLEGASPGVIVTEGDVAVLLNPMALNPGHSLVVPRLHVENIYELPDALAGPILSTAARVARVCRIVLAADGVTLRQNNGAASDQHLFHFHLHVIPRFVGDHERFGAEPRLMSIVEQQAIIERIRAALV
jgi:histidine triad (HIT) family protein